MNFRIRVNLFLPYKDFDQKQQEFYKKYDWHKPKAWSFNAPRNINLNLF